MLAEVKQGKKEYKDKSLFQFKYNYKTYSLRITAHAQERIDERNIDYTQVLLDIAELRIDEVLEIMGKFEAMMIVNDKDKIATVLAFDKCKLVIATVIDKGKEVSALPGTYVYHI